MKLLFSLNRLLLNTLNASFETKSSAHYSTVSNATNLSSILVKKKYFNEESSADKDLVFQATNNADQKAENISRAMTYYLEKLSQREKLMKFKTEEYEIGKRHLAKMMGENADTFTQADIDKAIEYLLPSGLFNKKARPFLRHPDDYYPKSKDALFGKDGRPKNHLFYTGNLEFYQFIYDITQKLINLNKFEDTMNVVKSRIKIFKSEKELENKFDMVGSVWLNRLDLSKKMNTNIDEFNYSKFLVLIQKLADHPYSKREQDFIKNFLVPFVPPIKLSDIKALSIDKNGRKYSETTAQQRTATVKLKMLEGTGNIKIMSPEGEFNIMYFETMTHRHQILFPFKVVDRINKFDLEIEINQGGMSCLAKAIRYAVSKALCSFVSADAIEKLRLAGLLTNDVRLKERKKPGREGARRRYTWKKR